MRSALATALGIALALAPLGGMGGCSRPPREAVTSGLARVEKEARQGTKGAELAPLAPDDLPEQPAQIPPERRVILVSEGGERIIDVEGARRAGYTVVDLSDGWTPYIFSDLRDPAGEPRPNRYRRIFQGLASDTLDDDGQPLDAGEKNYLELYGIPPTLSVLRARFLEEVGRECEKSLNLKLIAEVKGIRYYPPEKVPVVSARIARLKRELMAQMKVAELPDLAALAARSPELSDKVREVERYEQERSAFAEVERRLACEGIRPLASDHRYRHRPGLHDDGMRQLVARFQQKNMIFDPPYLRPRTVEALSRPMMENAFRALRRVIEERVISSAGILEDGSVEERQGPPTYTGKGGATLSVRNLAKEFTDAAMEQLGLTDWEKALAFLRRHPPADLAWLKVALRLPPKPEYYSEAMDLSITIDRGDVWYEVPFDDKGKEANQPRQVLPTFTLYANYLNQRIPLVRWRTTIGGWRSEQAADGYEYYRYKGSDVGPRVIRHVIAGPVWIAPESTPIRTLVKSRRVNRTWTRVVNYDELGPGFRSAYGLVAGYFVEPGKDGRPDHDNGIRAHGSAEYLSIGNPDAFSHGCHRLHNHLAVRLYSFILQHRSMVVKGDQALGYSRQFLFKDQVFEIRLPSKGYTFQLDPPLPVIVLEGRIRGELKKPIEEYVQKPGVVYPGPPPPVRKGGGDDRAGGKGDGGGKEVEAQ